MLALISGVVLICLIMGGVISNDDICGLLIFIACICLVFSPFFLADLNEGIETQEFYNTEYDVRDMVTELHDKKVVVWKHKIYKNETSFVRKQSLGKIEQWDYYEAVLPTPTTKPEPTPVINPKNFERKEK
jgi:hypothetical protein